MVHLTLTEQEFAHVLAGLRLLQRQPGDLMAYTEVMDELVLAEGYEELCNKDIDDLCERLNCQASADHEADRPPEVAKTNS